MENAWLNTLKRYFEKLNQLHIEGSTEELTSYLEPNGEDSAEQARLIRGRAILQNRNARPLKSKTTIRDFQMIHQSEDKVILVLSWSFWKLYQINQQFMEREEQQLRKLTLKKWQGSWRIVSDHVLGKETVEKDKEPAIETLALPNTEEQLLNEEEPRTQGRYNRAKAKRYAELWWDRYNPAYPKFDVDCTNFVSQCLHAGGLSLDVSGQRGQGWWFQGSSNWSYSWSVAHSLMLYLTNSKTKHGSRAEVKQSAEELMIGDVICYDWDGDGRYQHNTIVVAKDPNGMPLVNAHTINSRRRYWEYRDSHAWTENTKYTFIHIKE
ncbi:hypothetical protein BEP19_15090 [Ammoniphilus oxalaticus]|uniref:Putative amidase domain-containing protein n=1 Tax=Ammoniphilus oxalaticus TaxID=66863 RepID=A0A419SD36_9BACL|nr:amidase domain-containing protein [Ammoniphilus oxalaticus]RKD21005.1 hypothetical protein BEP19_15090 [Ammoniphilus oxalaticus]